MTRSPTILLQPRATDRFFTDADGEYFLRTGVIYCTGTEPTRSVIPFPAAPAILPRFARRMEQARRLQTATAR